MCPIKGIVYEDKVTDHTSHHRLILQPLVVTSVMGADCLGLARSCVQEITLIKEGDRVGKLTKRFWDTLTDIQVGERAERSCR